MPNVKSIFTICLIGLSAVAMPAQALRCGQDLVPDSASFSEVRRICGQPTDIQQWTEYRSVGVFPSPYSQRNVTPKGQHAAPTYVTPIIVPVDIEEWTYNLGPNRFMRVLRFEGGRLRSINILERGY
jgi:hypothetical protein